MKVSNTDSKKRIAVVFLLVVTFPLLLLAQTAGTLDNTFGTNGVTLTAIGTGNDFANAVAIQSDGKIVAAGYSITGTKYDFSLARYNTNGSLDNTFGNGGIVKTSVQTATDQIYSIVIQPDGKIVAGGVSSSTANSYDWALARYNPDGTLDNTFGTNGIVVSSLSSKQDYLYSLLLQNDGKIVGIGYSNDGTKSNFTLARYNSNGTLDASFGTNGVVLTSFDSNSSIARTGAILPDGKILAAGNMTASSISNFTIVKYNSNGTIDNTFGTAGKVVKAFGTSNEIIYSLLPMQDGQIVAGGTSRVGTVTNLAVARFKSNGDVDNTFGTNGITINQIGTTNASFGKLLNLPGVGLLACGYGTVNNVLSMVFLLYNSTDGKNVTSFGTAGIVSTAVGTTSAGANTMAMQKDGKVIVAGYAQGSVNYDYAIARIHTGVVVSVETVNENIPCNFTLNQNYPNPFNPSTTITFTIPENGYAMLRVYDAVGREVAILFNGYAEAGRYNKVEFETKNLTSGVYYAQLRFKNNVEQKKMLLVK